MITIAEKVAVLLGGPSSEREISIKSGVAVYNALISEGVDAVTIDASIDPIDQIKKQNAQIAFVALHGKFGEDGTIQKMLQDANILYTGSGPIASSLAIDKVESKKVFINAGLPTPDFLVVDKDGYKKGMPVLLTFPVVVKPNKEGSSIGMSIVKTQDGIHAAVEEAFKYDSSVLIEQFIKGDDLTVGILDNEVLPVVQIKPKSGVYDYTSKYTQGLTEYIVPAKIKKPIAKKAQEIALLAHRILGCHSFSRVDFRIDDNNSLGLLEVNTIPGLTATSLLPKAAKAAGIEFSQVCLKMLESAKKRNSTGRKWQIKKEETTKQSAQELYLST